MFFRIWSPMYRASLHPLLCPLPWYIDTNVRVSTFARSALLDSARDAQCHESKARARTYVHVRIYTRRARPIWARRQRSNNCVSVLRASPYALFLEPQVRLRGRSSSINTAWRGGDCRQEHTESPLTIETAIAQVCNADLFCVHLHSDHRTLKWTHGRFRQLSTSN